MDQSNLTPEEAPVERSGGTSVKRAKPASGQRDFMPHGSDQHAALLGLKKAGKEDTLQRDGWTLIDMTAFGPQATEAYLKEVLRQKVATLRAGPPPMPQSVDPAEPHYAPPMWYARDDPPEGLSVP